MSTYPAKTFAMAKKGHMRGLNKKEATAVQSRVMAPSPRPLRPDPSWWAVTDFGKAQQTHAILCKVWKRYPGNNFQEKLQTSAITKNFTRDRRYFPSSFSSFSCNVLKVQKEYTRVIEDDEDYIIYRIIL